MGDFYGLDPQAVFNTSAHIVFTRIQSYSFIYHKLARNLSISTCTRGKRNGFGEHSPLSLSQSSAVVKKYTFCFSSHSVKHTHPLPRKTQNPKHSFQSIESLRIHDDAKSFLTCLILLLMVWWTKKRNYWSPSDTDYTIGEQGQCNHNKHSHSEKRRMEITKQYWCTAVLKSYGTDITNLTWKERLPPLLFWSLAF